MEVLRGVSRDDVQARLAEFADPIQVYLREELWRLLPCDPERGRRYGGTGLNRLHIDLINTTNPPDYVAFWCEHPDEGGGGQSLVAPTDFPRSDEWFEHGAFHDLGNVGDELNPFPLCGEWGVRYSDALVAPEVREQVWDQVRVVELGAGDGLIVDQHTEAHGRLPIFGVQRRMWTLYGRAR